MLPPPPCHLNHKTSGGIKRKMSVQQNITAWFGFGHSGSSNIE
jgi:hypothetical protein